MEKTEIENEKELLDKGWIKVWVLFDVQSNDSDFTEKALKEHISKMKKESGIVVGKETTSDVEEVDAPPAFRAQGIDKMYSQVYEAIIFINNFETLINFTVTYAPTAIEVLSPEKLTIKLSELQSALVTISDMMHKFAQSGLGGVIISG